MLSGHSNIDLDLRSRSQDHFLPKYKSDNIPRTVPLTGLKLGTRILWLVGHAYISNLLTSFLLRCGNCRMYFGDF